MDKTINKRIAYYRKLRGLLQTEVAEAVGMKGSTYSQCERKGRIPCELLIKLSEVLDVSCNVLLFGEEDEKTNEKVDTPDTATENLELTNSEISLIKVLRSFPCDRNKATRKIIQLIWKRKLNPYSILENIEQ